MSYKQKWETVPIRTEERVTEVAWFDNIIGGDTDYLRLHSLQTSWDLITSYYQLHLRLARKYCPLLLLLLR